MNKWLVLLTALLVVFAPAWARAEEPATNPAPPAVLAAPVAASAQGASTAELEKRIVDLEAYVNNGARSDADLSKSKVGGPGPGHNGWMMVCSALVLFMTLPGLALFYGGLVRSKN